MPVQFAILASGSRGNAALVQAGGVGLLIDAGLGVRRLADRLEGVGSGWERIGCVLLTHTHGDHVDDATLGALARRGAVLYCHEGHRHALSRHAGYRALDQAGLTRDFEPDRPFLTPAGMRVEPFRLSHDGGPTFGFRIEARPDRGGRWAGLGYLADTGTWTDAMVDAVADVDLLGVEFNHDVELQRRSTRSPYLIARNLGDRGHLSNDQGAGFVSAVLARSKPGAVRHLVLLHLSDDCNRPELALKAARGVLRSAGRRSSVHATIQQVASPDLRLVPARRRRGSMPVESGFPWERSA